MPAELPDFVPPMLAKSGDPFDSDEYLFEVKWDGIRAVCTRGNDPYRLTSRTRNDLTPRYPELGFFERLPPGMVLDGEIAVLNEDGRADFKLTMSREHARDRRRIEGLSRSRPVIYFAFDVMYVGFESAMEQTLVERRKLLKTVVDAIGEPRLVYSDGIEGAGKQFFAEVTSRGIEGVVAKRLVSRYHAGRRTGDWIKMKPVHHLLCAIIGFLPEGEDDIKSLLIATSEEGGPLECVGRVGSGLTAAMRKKLARILRERLRDTPLIDSDFDGLWVEPGLYCTVSYPERTETGMLRGPVFVELVAD